MKVIIKKSGSAHYWYADKIGFVFDVKWTIIDKKFMFVLKNEYKYIHENDAIPFSILDFILINWPYFIGRKKQITRKF